MKWWFFLMLKVGMARGRKLKNSGDLEVQKKNVTSSKQTTRKQNINPLQLRLRDQMLLRHNQRPGE